MKRTPVSNRTNAKRIIAAIATGWLLMTVAIGCSVPGSKQANVADPVFDSGGNIVAGCAQTFDPARDYFPSKLEISVAKNLTMEYHLNYKVLTWQEPSAGAPPQRYVLVQCGTPAPELTGALADVTGVVEVPIKRVAAMSTTFLAYFEQYGIADRVVSVNRLDEVRTKAIRDRIDQGQLIETGNYENTNLELLSSVRADAVLGLNSGGPEGLEFLRNKGFPAINADGSQTELTPLGRSEAIGSAIAALSNQERQAAVNKAEIRANYDQFRNQAQSLPTRPTVAFVWTSSAPLIYASSGSHWLARLARDAGGDYLFPDEGNQASLKLDMEEFYRRARTVNFLINNSGSSWKTASDLTAEDPRFAEFDAVRTGGVVQLRTSRFDPETDVNFWEQGIARPDILLKDLIAVLHPGALDGHQPQYFICLPQK